VQQLNQALDKDNRLDLHKFLHEPHLKKQRTEEKSNSILKILSKFFTTDKKASKNHEVVIENKHSYPIK
jgi:hypothetical protein